MLLLLLSHIDQLDPMSLLLLSHIVINLTKQLIDFETTSLSGTKQPGLTRDQSLLSKFKTEANNADEYKYKYKYNFRTRPYLPTTVAEIYADKVVDKNVG